MIKNNNLKEKINWTSISVVLFLVCVIVTMAFVSKQSIEAIRNSVEVKREIDSVNYKIDSRYYSYDNLFFQTNSIVVDSLSEVIGEIYILTNDKEIDSFYKDSTRIKTKYYQNLKDRKLKIIEKND